MRKALNILTLLSMTRYADLGLFTSCYSLETHTFILACGEEFVATIEDVEVMFRFSLFTDHSAMGIVLTEEEERTLQLPNAALVVANKSMYAL